MTSKSPGLVLPAKIVRSEYQASWAVTPEFSLNEFLTPWNEAKDGGLFAICLNFYKHSEKPDVRHNELLIITQELSSGIRRLPILLLSKEQLSDFVPGSLPFMIDATQWDTLWDLAKDMCRHDSVPRSISIIVTAKAALIISTEPDVYRDHWMAEGIIHEEELASYIALVIPPTKSAHEEIALKEEVQPLINYANQAFLKGVLNGEDLVITDDNLFKT